MRRRNLSLWGLHLVLFATVGGRATAGKKLYISSASGDDSWSCSQLKPCKTIGRAITLASRGDQIYLDGAETDKHPYTCHSETLGYPGIYINKSLYLIGYGSSMPRIRCSDGKGLLFNGSDDGYQMKVTLAGLLVTGSVMIFQDSSAEIDGCKFQGNKKGLMFTISNEMVSIIQITNSTFSENRQCISVVVNSTRNASVDVQVVFKITNSSFNYNILSDQETCISVIESPRGIQPVSCNISLESVAFARNNFGPKGIILLAMNNGREYIDLQNVTFLDNGPLAGLDVFMDHGHSEWNVQGSVVDISISLSKFESHNARSFNLSATNVSLALYNSAFFGQRISGKGGVVSMSATDVCMINVSGSSFSNTSGAQGGVLNIECTNVFSANFQNNNFTNHSARNGGGGVVYLFSPAWVWNYAEHSVKTAPEPHKRAEELTQVSFTKCSFTNAYSSLEGGAVCIYAVKASVKIHHSEFRNCSARDEKDQGGGGGGGVLIYTGLPSPKPETGIDLFLTVETSLFMGCSSAGLFLVGGTLAAVYKRQVGISINNSDFISNNGGAISIFPHLSSGKRWTKNSNVTIQHSMFLNNVNIVNDTQQDGGAVSIMVYNQSTVVLENVTMKYNRVGGFGGAAAIADNCSLEVYQCRFLQNTASDCGGAIYGFDLNLLHVQGSLFDGNNGSALCTGNHYAVSPIISIFDTRFINCSTKSSGGAISLSNPRNLHLEVTNSLFAENAAFTDLGGAISLTLRPDTLKNPGCIEEDTARQISDYPSWDYKSHLCFEDTIFERNAAASGGAVHLANGKAVFKNCSFMDNIATTQGGHIYTVPGSASLIIQDTFFLQTANELLTLHGLSLNASMFSFIHAESSGAFKVYNTRFDARRYGISIPLMEIKNGRLIDLGDKNFTVFNCPVGSQMAIVNVTTEAVTSVNDKPCKIELLTLAFRCLACPVNSYSLQRGQVLGSQLVPGFQCLPCPFGANCSHNIIAKPNFWGFKERNNPRALKFTMCPLGYCRPPYRKTNYREYNDCQGNRTGELCGQCKEAHTETLYSTHCRPSHECNDYWFWPVAFVYISLLAWFFTFQPPIVPWIKRQILWFKHHEPANHDNVFNKGYVKILFYFYQVSNLVFISTSVQHAIATKFVEPFIGLFNFKQKLSSGGLFCPFPGLTVVTKQLFSVSQVFGTLLMIGIFYILRLGVQKYRGQEAPSVGPYIGGVLQTMLLGYTTLASVSFSLLRCVPIGSELRLFFDGNIVCFQWWQYSLIVFILTFFVPFVFVLLWGSLKLYNRMLSAGEFLTACCFPLPFIIYWAYTSLFRGARNAVVEEPPYSQVSRAYVERILYDSFKMPENGGMLSLSWESVMIGRRLILIVLKVFISDPMLRLLIMSLFCNLFLLHHAFAQPFRDSIANKVETISLMSIVVLAAINVFFASFLSLAVPLNGHFTHWWNACQVVQIVILCFVPALFAVLVVAAVISQVCRLTVVVCRILHHMYVFCLSWFCRKKGHNEMSPLLT